MYIYVHVYIYIHVQYPWHLPLSMLDFQNGRIDERKLDGMAWTE